MTKVGFKEIFNPVRIAPKKSLEQFGYDTRWSWEHIGLDGKVKDSWQHGNVCVDEGITKGLDILFGASSKLNWYIALIRTGSHTPIATDTYQSVMSEAYYEFISYSEASRPAWIPGTAANKSIDNTANKVQFTMGSGGPFNIYGAALVSNSVKNDASAGNFLFAFGLFPEPKLGYTTGEILQLDLTLNSGQI